MRIFVLALVMVVGLSSAAQAGTGQYYTERRPYPIKALAKLGRGLANVVWAPTELYRQPFKEAERANAGGDTWLDIHFVGVFTGFWVGIGYTVARVGVGIFDTATFVVPTRPLMRPATPPIFFEDVPPLPKPRS